MGVENAYEFITGFIPQLPMTDPQLPRIRASVLSTQPIGDSEKVCQSKDCRHLRAGIKQDTNLNQSAGCGDVAFAPHFVVFAHLHAVSLGFQMQKSDL